ncbi:MAG: Ig-like domain-containing protein [Bacteroidales bacterium]|nr:Ig-like domain-containing protein [Bacteroidales bacterium]
MRKLFRTSITAIVTVALSMTFFSCGPEEPDNNGGGGNGGNGGGGSSTVSVTGVTISKTSLSLVEGGSETLTATVTPDNATNKAVSWKSSDATIATVDNSGKVTAVKAGSATITVTTTDGSKTSTCTVTVTAKTVTVSGVALDHDKLELTTGETEQLKATVSPDNASDKSVEWTSSDAKVATVDATGKVTAVQAGTTTITVKTKDGGKTATCSVTVTPIAVESVTVEPAAIEIKEGATTQLKATVSPADADQSVEWASQNGQIATVDGNGLVTAVKVGKTVIAVRSKSFPDKQGLCEVTVTPDDALKGISFDVKEIQIQAGETRTLIVTYNPEYAADKNVTWKSSDNSIATVANGKVVGVKEGIATITATSEEGGFTAECKVTVTKTSGPIVYTLESGGVLKVNGVPDPMDGAYNVGNSVKYIRTTAIDTDGKHLYSFEHYYTSDGEEAWFCKDRKPMFEVTSQVKSYVFYGFSARNGIYALVLLKDFDPSDLLVIKYKEGDKYVDSFSLKGTAKEFFYPYLAVAPSGDLHVTSNFIDSFNHSYLGWFNISTAGTLKSTFLNENNSGYVDVTQSGDVYIFTCDEGSDGTYGRLYKNGKLDKTIDKVAFNYYQSIRCVGNDVYTLTNDFPKKQIRIHKNGVLFKSFNVDKDVIFGDDPFWVTSKGDVYVSVTGHSEWSDNRLYKNENILYTSNKEFIDVCVIESQ